MRWLKLLTLLVLLAMAIINKPLFVLGANSNSTISYYPSVYTDRAKYSINEYIRVFGVILGPHGRPPNENVTIQTKPLNDSSGITQNLTQIARTYSINGSYSYNSLVANKEGKYILTVLIGSNKEGNSVIYNVIPLWKSWTFFFATAALLSFTTLAILMLALSLRKKPSDVKSQGKHRYFQTFEVMRFILFSAIVGFTILAFIFNDVGIGVNSYVGVVLKQQPNANGNPLVPNGLPVNQWVLNFGGSWFDNYSSGIQIPLYVFYFGLIGGYLRYLYKALLKGGGKDAEGPNLRKLTKIQILRETSGELAEILLPPALAMIAYFIMQTGGKPDVSTISIVSFSVGFITRDFIQAIVNFTRSALRLPKEGQENTASYHSGAGIS